jgi:hypothetical protein
LTGSLVSANLNNSCLLSRNSVKVNSGKAPDVTFINDDDPKFKMHKNDENILHIVSNEIPRRFMKGYKNRQNADN